MVSLPLAILHLPIINFDVTIPDCRNGIAAFANNQLTSVTIPDGITSIGVDTFSIIN